MKERQILELYLRLPISYSTTLRSYLTEAENPRLSQIITVIKSYNISDKDLPVVLYGFETCSFTFTQGNIQGFQEKDIKTNYWVRQPQILGIETKT